MKKKRRPNKLVLHNCIDCEVEVNFKKFTPTPRCKKCYNLYIKERYRDAYPRYRANARKTAREWRLKKYYGISSKDYEILLENQEYKCYICGHPHKEKDKLVVDHNHLTGNVRGLLCHNCNRGLGVFKDDKTLLEKAIKYLEKEAPKNEIK
jgi:hypothetical protein